jgi:hypothetical protein
MASSSRPPLFCQRAQRVAISAHDAVQQWAIGSQTESSALTRMPLEGLAIGLYAALNRFPEPGQGPDKGEIAEARRELDRNFGEAGALT